MLREAGIHINEVPKIHVTSPTEEHHAITLQETNFQIPLALHGTFSYFPTSKPNTQELEEPEDVYVLTPTIWNPHSDAYVINEESMLDWEGNMKHEKDHEKRVVLENIPSDDTMISSLALCEKEQMVVSSYFVDQDEDINAVHGFEDEHQLYQALNMRYEHGQFAVNIGATSIFDQTYMDDDDSQIPVMMLIPHRIIQMMILTQCNWMMTQMRYFLTTSWLQLLKLGNLEELTLSIFPRFGLLMSLLKRPFKQMIQAYQEITLPMIGCSGIKGSRTSSSWIPSLQPRKVANHQEAILAVNVLSLIKDSYMLFQ